MKQKSELDTVVNLNKKLRDESTKTIVELAKIKNPSAEVTEALTSFITAKLEQQTRDDDFNNLVKMYIRQRLPEFSVDQLLALNNQNAMNSNRATESILPLFKNEQSGKTVIDQLNDNSSVSNNATQLYNSNENKDMLQAVTYLNQVLSRLPKPDGPVTEDK